MNTFFKHSNPISLVVSEIKSGVRGSYAAEKLGTLKVSQRTLSNPKETTYDGEQFLDEAGDAGPVSQLRHVLPVNTAQSSLNTCTAGCEACSMSQQLASVSKGWSCSDFTCCHTETDVTDQIFYLTQSRYTDTRPTSPSTDLILPGAWQGSHWSASF